MTIDKALHPRDDGDRQYISRIEGGREFASIEDSVDAWIQGLMKKHEGGLNTAMKNNTDNTISNRMTITRKEKWEQKQLYRRYKQLTDNISHEKS